MLRGSACGLQKQFGAVFALCLYIQHAVESQQPKLEASTLFLDDKCLNTKTASIQASGFEKIIGCHEF